jgi:hypothetical protein
VFTPPLNTLWRRDLNKKIPDSIENGGGVKVLSGFQGGRRNKFFRISSILFISTAINEAPSTSKTAEFSSLC